MENIPSEELKERYEMLLDNDISITFGEDLRPKIGLIPFTDEPHWMEITTHVLEECSLRGYPYPGPLGEPQNRGVIGKINLDRSYEVFKRAGLQNGTFKLGMLEHLLPMREDGMIRMSIGAQT